MCGALSEKGDAAQELAFATTELSAAFRPSDWHSTSVGGNWTRDERAALAGDYRPLLSVLAQVRMGTLFLELCTPRAGEIDAIVERARRAIEIFNADRVLLTPDCGFATSPTTPSLAPLFGGAPLNAPGFRVW
jgi:5-methyltetrahydropteroyltriglutamate--homocysteine methyltransferase